MQSYSIRQTADRLQEKKKGQQGLGVQFWLGSVWGESWDDDGEQSGI